MFFYFLIYSAVTVKRLRDTVLSVWPYPVFAFGPFAWLWFSSRTIPISTQCGS